MFRFTTRQAIALTIVALVVCVVLGIAAAMYGPLCEKYSAWREDRMDEAGWLPTSEEVVAVRAEISHANADGSLVWETVELPHDSVAQFLECLARRVEPNYPKRSKPFRLVEYDMNARVWIQLDVSHRSRPVRIGLVRSRIVRIGSKYFVVPAEDGEQLMALVDASMSHATQELP